MVNQAVRIVLVLGAFAATPWAAEGSTCPPATPEPVATASAGAGFDLQWQAVAGGVAYRVWAQWRIPEGAAVHTHELQVAAPPTRIPPSPMPWRPLVLSLEVQTLCTSGASSTPGTARQVQFDPASACPPPQGLQADRAARHLRWEATPSERFVVAWYSPADGRLLQHDEDAGPASAWPPAASGPLLAQVSRACAAGRRSAPAYLLVP